MNTQMKGFRILLGAGLIFVMGAYAQQEEGAPEKVTREQVAEAMNRAPKGHPRLFVDGERFKTLLAELQATELGSLAFERLCFDADALLALPPCTRVMEGKRLLAVSNRALHRLPVLAMAYRLTGKEDYLKRCVQELDAVIAFEDWNPSHYLDVAEMSLAVAVAYDWLYHDLDADTRARVGGGLLDKGLNAAKAQSGWVKARNNWGQVCHAGMMAAAFALQEEHPGPAVDAVHRAIINLPLSMRASFSPGGGYPEGPGYWRYGTDFNVLAIAMLCDILGTDFGLTAIPGFAETADYMDVVTGPSGLTFNYADGGTGRSTSCATWWFARHLKRPDLLAYFEGGAFARYCKDRAPLTANRYGNRLFAFFLPWLQPLPEGGGAPKSPLCWAPGGGVPIVVLRSSWDNQAATFIGLKAGPPNGPHGHMDAGSFVLDMGGVRWAHDLGMENYHPIEARGMGLWGTHQGSERWTIYRLNNFSHNTLTLGGGLQLAAGNTKVTAFQEGGDPSATLDLSPVYTNAASVTRSVMLDLRNGKVSIKDSLAGVPPGTTVRWAMMTKATPPPPGEARLGSIELQEGGKRLKLTALHDAKLEWKTEDASPPKNEWDSPNKGFTQIFFEVPAPPSGELSLVILFSLEGDE